jgi:hypothetical protein
MPPPLEHAGLAPARGFAGLHRRWPRWARAPDPRGRPALVRNERYDPISPEWNEITPDLRPREQRAACGRASISACTVVHGQRIAWNVRVATWRRRGHAAAARSLTASTRSSVLTSARTPRRSRSRGDAAGRSSPYSKRIRASCRRESIERSAAVGPADQRMSDVVALERKPRPLAELVGRSRDRVGWPWRLARLRGDREVEAAGAP